MRIGGIPLRAKVWADPSRRSRAYDLLSPSLSEARPSLLRRTALGCSWVLRGIN